MQKETRIVGDKSEIARESEEHSNGIAGRFPENVLARE